MANQLEGVIHVVGEHDTGKTTFALECGADPSRILFFDDDVKGRSTVKELENSGVKFGRYVDLIELSEKRNEYDYHRKVIEIIRSIEMDQYDAIVWDTWTTFAATTHSYVLKHPGEFRLNWAPMGTIKGAQQWQEARKYEAALINFMAQRTKTLILITHLKDHYVGKLKVPGKQVPAASSILERVPRFRIWLRQSEDGRPVPIGLVLKRLDKKIIVPGVGIRTTSMLPRKIVAAADEYSLWDTIWRYWREPYGDRSPLPEEVPNEFELSILDGTLTRDQARTFRGLVEGGFLDGEPEIVLEEGNPEMIEKVRELRAEGKTNPVIARELKMALPVVLRIVETLEEEEEEPVVEEA